MRFATIPHQNVPVLWPEPLVNQEFHLSPIGKLEEIPQPPLQLTFQFHPPLQKYLAGRHLLIEEIPFPLEMLHEHYLHGFIRYEKGITKENNGFYCHRCGNKDQGLFAAFSCYRCKEECTYCRNCIMMGRISQCTPLLRWKGPESHRQVEGPILHWEGKLSELQKKASVKITNMIGSSGELLVWAVCGAGKTEILFKGIEKAIESGLSVCLATPRTDVVTELLPRFEKAFPNVDVQALYGGESNIDGVSQLTLSTTHQLLRFRNAFDVMIVDEVDAFPYSYDPTLQFAVKKACKKGASHVYLSATPSKELIKKVSNNELDVVSISQRYHGYPLPVPEFRWCGNWMKKLKKRRLPKVVSEWVAKNLEENRQCFLFVPTVKCLNEVRECIQDYNSVEFVHANDPDRIEKVNRFRKGEVTMLVTTTILERGVTVPKIDVSVLGAEHEVFTSNALIQMAGRVGRSVEDPYGEVVYFHFGKSRAMVSAKQSISKHNDQSSEETEG